jgi:hypothetical protein
MTLSRRSKQVLMGLAFLAALYAANYSLTPELVGVVKLEEHCRPRGQLEFDSESWKQTSPASGKRFEMVDSLLESGSLLNLDATQIETLLGKADIVSDQQAEKQFVYLLADQCAFPAKSLFFPGLFANLDQWWLEIRLRDGKTYLARVFFT